LPSWDPLAKVLFYYQLMSLLHPRIPCRDLLWLVAMAAGGSLVAGIYGIIHDQITFTLAPEYFTRMKFQQFAWADVGWPRRWFVAEIGFLASWWVGLIAGWFLGRMAVPGRSRAEAMGWFLRGMAVIVGCAAACAGLGGGLARCGWGMVPSWLESAQDMGVQDTSAFLMVGWIHNGSYFGGAAGLLIALFLLKKRLRPAQPRPPAPQGGNC